jgi:hypothetical protein
MKKPLLLALVFVSALATPALAQVSGGPQPPRAEDHFHRRKILMRIDLREKLNRPIIHRQGSTYDAASNSFRYNQGLISALLSAYESGEVMGYVPDTLSQPLTWDAFAAAFRRVGTSPEAQRAEAEAFPTEPSEPGFGFGDETGLDFPDETDFEPEPTDNLSFVNAAGNPRDASGFTAEDRQNMVASFASYIEVVEDRIFDRNRSDMYHDVQYVRLVYVDPEGILPDRAFVSFRYQDLSDLLANTRCNNRWNDAEYRSMRETFDQRSFHAFIISISGNDMLTLDQSAQHQQRLTEFEHNLWEY